MCNCCIAPSVVQTHILPLCLLNAVFGLALLIAGIVTVSTLKIPDDRCYIYKSPTDPSSDYSADYADFLSIFTPKTEYQQCKDNRRATIHFLELLSACGFFPAIFPIVSGIVGAFVEKTKKTAGTGGLLALFIVGTILALNGGSLSSDDKLEATQFCG
ncbi:hypothetical protein GUITHDRAFT_100542 [Guillardia theta CCMP2712]|uniref:Uncharacterized protein n=1 Tax=Guillardia theta (strain CCMP2712) TaxID=905079 RepID=L1JZB8_GUITC|nr:hypothetical protein GUITHDRAFT_100542 [Guillardia theta CCMP2712]EKX53555.1 hypothetical protein GUITHDRAFT_100542 [Guillardia theta CCMP2712]|eukprot:XP_005840535.1 hypothetical protein GUITHDRAFT_100542 [Guillardia theta CCMP2712]